MHHNLKIDKLNILSEESDEYILYGIGRNIDLYRQCLKGKIKVAYGVDSNEKLHGTEIEGIKIESPAKLENMSENQKILILTGSICSVRKQLNQMNKVEYKDYFYVRDFIPIWYWRQENKIVLTDTSFLITFMCTLKCKYCSLKIPYCKEKEHRKLVDLKNDLDLYFKSVDFVYNFKIMGGEPTMLPELAELIRYIGEKYRKKIGNVKLVTNATIPLSDEILKAIKEHNVMVEINDYSEFVCYKNSVVQYIKKLEMLQIPYVSYRTTRDDKWVFFGNPREKKFIEESEIRQHFHDCAYYSRGLVNGKLYYCTINAALAELKVIEYDDNDYLDLLKAEGKDNFFDLEIGNLKKGYCTLCESCNGDYDVNQVLLPAGEQLGGKNE